MSERYSVTLHYQGEVKTIEVPEDEYILKTAEEQGLKLPSSCNAGVCTTCAAKIRSGEVDQSEVIGLNPDLQAEGYALLCVAKPQSDLTIEVLEEDAVYDLQFGSPSTN